VNPFRHYIEHGRQEGLSPRNQTGREPHLRLVYDPGLIGSLNAVPSLRPFDENDYCMEVPFQFDLSTVAMNRVAAIIHVYYPDLLPKILSYLRNIP
jgi:O-antigen biosynthesis protein